MLKWCIACLFTLPLFGSSFGNKEIAAFDKIVQQCLEECQIPSIAVGVIVDGKPVFSKAYGFRDAEKKLAANSDTLYPIGSCTKAFTSCLIGTFVDEGHLEWDHLVSDLIPNLRLWDAYATNHLTLRDLLTHRTGLPRHEWVWYNASYSRDELIRRLRYLEPVCGMRERFYYNSWLYFLTASALEHLTGKSWEQLTQERILSPLGMKRTNFSVALTQKDSNFASPYIVKGGKLKKMPFRDLTLIGPGGGINSTVSEMLCWMQMQLNHGIHQGKTILSPATWQEIATPQIVSGALESKAVVLDTYGIGWHIQSYRGRFALSHDGGTDGFTSTVTLLPYQNTGVVVLCNRNLTPIPKFLAYYLFDILLDCPPIDPVEEARTQLRSSSPQENEDPLLCRKKGTSPSHDSEDFTGEYFHPGYGTVSVEKKDQGLQATFNGISYTLDHWHYDVFVISEESQDKIFPSLGMKFTFRTNLSGEIDELLIPFEPSILDIPFKKQPKDPLAYLSQFVGEYQIYHYTVEIALRNQTLCVLIPGQPVYELISTSENEFKVKSLIGYTVRFMKDENYRIKEVILVQPYGTFTAKRRV